MQVVAGKAAAAPSPAGYNPDINAVDSWITVGADNTVTLKMSQIEVGNGITTGFLQVLAEELDMDMSQMYYGRYENQPTFAPHADTWIAVSTGGEGGSNAMSGQGPEDPERRSHRPGPRCSRWRRRSSACRWHR